MIRAFKLIISKLIANNFTGIIISSIFKDKIPYFSGTTINTKFDVVNSKIKSMLFWRLYEGQEARSVIKYIQPNDVVVELGSSIGAIGSVIGKKIGSSGMLYSVEGNKDLIPLIETNFKLNKVPNYKIIDGCIGNSQTSLWFVKSRENTHGYITDQFINGGLPISSITLSEILKQEEIEEFVLVCDIEGAEIDILLKDKSSLNKCKLVIIETHKVSRSGVQYDSDYMKNIFLELNFELIDSNGVNFVFKKA